MSQGNLIGQTLAQYTLRELLGVGGMGAVYRAYQNNLKREVAVKIISSHLVANAEAMGRFIREAEISASLEHNNIVPIYDFGTQQNITYVVMRLLTGGSLARRIEQRVEDARPLTSLGETADLLRQVASALDYAHSRGIIHRDIKPANIMFDNQGKPYVVDFGIAKLTQGGASFTQTGMAMGTPNYMPPEQWRGENLTPTADQYALAVMTYQLLTGRVPFDGDSAFSLMHKHLNEAPTPLSMFRPDIPPAVMMVLNRAMAKDYRQRFQSCTAFAQAFESAIEGNKGQPTGMFMFKVRQSQTNAMPISNHPYTPTNNMPIRPPASSNQNSNSKNMLIGGLGLALIAVMVLVIILLTGNNRDDTALSDGGSPTASNLVILSNPTATDGIIILPTTDEQTQPTEDNTPLDARSIAQTLVAEENNATATSQSLTATISAELATIRQEMQIANDTATARAWTATPVPTNTPSATHTPTTTPTATIPTGYSSETYITDNDQWVFVEQDFDGVLMVLVPAGCFMMGSGDEQIEYGVAQLGMQNEWMDDEIPIHEQCFNTPFWIDKYEVTNGQFADFNGVAGRNSNWIGNNLPRERITWFEARDYCENNRGGRLPTEREWEYASRGPNNLIYPWGNDFVSDNVVYSRNSSGETAPVGSRENGVSWVGSLDMSGNIREWVSSLYVPYPYSENSESVTNNSSTRVLRGGFWGNTDDLVRSANRGNLSPYSVSDGIGFRCVRSF